MLQDEISGAKSSKDVGRLKASLKNLQEKKAEIHEMTHLDEFLQDIKDPNKCGNILDRMNISSGDRPWFIRFVLLDL